MQTFETEADLLAFARDRFSGTPVGTEPLSEFLAVWDGVHPESVATASENAEAFRAINARRRWVIRDDDLKVLNALGDGIKSAAAAGFFTGLVGGPQQTSALVAMLVAGALFVRQAWKKSTTLDPLPFRLLLMLKANAPRGLSEDEALEILKRTAPSTGRKEVADAIALLNAWAVRDGSVQRFAEKDGNGRWHAAGV